MKRSLTLLGIAVLCVITFSQLFAKDRESLLLLSMSGNTTARVGAINTSSGNLNLSLTDQNGNVVFHESVKKQTNYFRFYDFSSLKDGLYSLSLAGHGITQEREFVVRANLITLIKSAPEIKPRFIEQGKDYLFIVYNNPEQDNIDVSFTKNGKMVFTDNNNSAAELKKKYTLKNLDRGEYTVKVSTNDREYQYNLVVP